MLKELVAFKVGICLTNLFLGVHDERAVHGNGFIDRRAGVIDHLRIEGGMDANNSCQSRVAEPKPGDFALGNCADSVDPHFPAMSE